MLEDEPNYFTLDWRRVLPLLTVTVHTDCWRFVAVIDRVTYTTAVAYEETEDLEVATRLAAMDIATSARMY